MGEPEHGIEQRERTSGRYGLADLLGHTVFEGPAREICRRYGLTPPDGYSEAARSYLAREAGLELAADAHGVITKVFLHFHGDDGFAAYRGDLPGGGTSEPSRSALRAQLGSPAATDDAYRDRYLGDFGPADRWLFPAFVLRAQYALDGEKLCRITLSRHGR